MADRRVLFVGESFVAGVGDPTGLGWVGRVVAASHDAGRALTAYNLGVRRDTSLDVAARWEAEAGARMRDAHVAYGLVLGVGVNDMTLHDGRPRVAVERSLAALASMIDSAAGAGVGVFVVGPPPAGEAEHDARVAALSASFAELAAARAVPCVATVAALRGSAAWTGEAAAGDGTHPAGGGYAALARLVLDGGWLDWLDGLGRVAEP